MAAMHPLPHLYPFNLFTSAGKEGYVNHRITKIKLIHDCTLWRLIFCPVIYSKQVLTSGLNNRYISYIKTRHLCICCVMRIAGQTSGPIGLNFFCGHSLVQEKKRNFFSKFFFHGKRRALQLLH